MKLITWIKISLVQFLISRKFIINRIIIKIFLVVSKFNSDQVQPLRQKLILIILFKALWIHLLQPNMTNQTPLKSKVKPRTLRKGSAATARVASKTSQTKWTRKHQTKFREQLTKWNHIPHTNSIQTFCPQTKNRKLNLLF